MALTLDGSSGMIAPVGAVYNGLQSGTAVASTSGTSIDFTSIPSWVKRITVIFNGVSTSGTSLTQIQLGAGSVTTTGYLGASMNSSGAALNTINYTTGLINQAQGASTAICHGHAIFTLVSGNTWVGSLNMARSDATLTSIGSTSITLSGALDRVRITTVNGTDTFDAGSINILWE